MKDEILRLLLNSDDVVTATFRAIMPKRARQGILDLAHRFAEGGHFGVLKTVNNLKHPFYWNRMTRDVLDLCDKCLTFNRDKTQQHNRATMQPIDTGEPFKLVAIDSIWPLPKTHRINRYILTIVYHFTKQNQGIRFCRQQSHDCRGRASQRVHVLVWSPVRIAYWSKC